MTRFDDSLEPIVVTTRSGFEESLHYGAGVAIDAMGNLVAQIGNPDLVIYPRSSLKPLQATAMVDLGLDLPTQLLAIVIATHDGAPAHLDAVRQVLERFDLDESDLGNAPSRPLDDVARAAARKAGTEPSSLQQNCSGKHAGMLATCRINGWSLSGYQEEDHPLQVAITARMADFGCTVHHIGIDGCGAPTHALELRALAGAFGAIASSGSRVSEAMMSRPDLVGGPTRDVTLWMQSIPDLIVKDGTDGVMAAAVSDGRACAYKIADGSSAARQAVIIGALRAMEVDLDRVATETIDRLEVRIFGGGRDVGAMIPLAWSR